MRKNVICYFQNKINSLHMTVSIDQSYNEPVFYIWRSKYLEFKQIKKKSKNFKSKIRNYYITQVQM